jgi:transcriptional regulator with XRE-family HTH domain
MAKRVKSSKSDSAANISLERDTWTALSEILRDTRLKRLLTQHQLAGKLGLRQRQISDLERSTTDPRLSTIQNVARALDLEVMLVPRQLITAVQGLLRGGAPGARRPLYSLGDEIDTGPDDDLAARGTEDVGVRNEREYRERKP